MLITNNAGNMREGKFLCFHRFLSFCPGTGVGQIHGQDSGRWCGCDGEGVDVRGQ